MAGRVSYYGGIVRNGLVLHLDAAKKDSYPGSGTLWRDLSGNGNNVNTSTTLIFDRSVDGDLFFNGTSAQYANFSVQNLTQTTTIEIWAKVNNNSSNMFFGWLYYDVYFYQNSLGFNTGVADLYGIDSTTVTNLGLIGNWRQYVFEMRSDVSYSNNKIWINGQQQTTSKLLVNSENSTFRNFNNGNGRIACWGFDLNYMTNMNLSVFKIYNRSLTSSEVLQNYNALKGRYGL